MREICSPFNIKLKYDPSVFNWEHLVENSAGQNLLANKDYNELPQLELCMFYIKAIMTLQSTQHLEQRQILFCKAWKKDTSLQFKMNFMAIK